VRETRLDAGPTLPLVISPDAPAERPAAALEAWIRERARALEARLLEVGGILFRGFEVADAPGFARVAQAFGRPLQAYVEGQSQRERVHGRVYTSTSYPARERVTLHNELSYVAAPPRHIFFCCLVPAAEGGETPIVDGRRVLEWLPPPVLEAFRSRGIQYVKNMHGGGTGSGFGKSWQEHFETDEREAVEAHLRANGVDFEWLADGTLRTRQVRPALGRHPETGEAIWFNQASLWHVSNLGRHGRTLLRTLGEAHLPTHACFENGEPIADELLAAVRATTWERASFFPWQAGDVLWLDNHLVAHGRSPFSGERRILVAMG
jgi:alpha-ketoglutarate-dependent taurine dioxygenase